MELKENDKMSGHIVKVVIENTKPPIWRRIALPEKIRFDDLHEIIQIAFRLGDIHSHSFSLPYDSLKIVPFLEKQYLFTVKETDVIYEDYCDKVNWIRYRYDLKGMPSFKIIYEKQDTQYAYRYAQVLKTKGDVFESIKEFDWNDEMKNTPDDFTEKKVNTSLEEFVIRKSKSNLESVVLNREKQLENEIKKISEEIQQYHNKLEEMKKAGIEISAEDVSANDHRYISKLSQSMEEWQAFAEKKIIGKSQQDLGNDIKKTKNIKSNQTSLFNEDRQREETFEKIKVVFPKEKYEIQINKPLKTVRQHLGKLSAEEVDKYSKFLQTPHTKKTIKKEKLDRIGDFLTKNPEHYLWVFEKEEWRALESLARYREGEAFPKINVDAISKAIIIGLLDCKVTKTNYFYRIDFTFAKDMKSILKTVNHSKSTRIFRQLENLEKKLMPLLIAYGMIDLESFHLAFNKYWGQNITFTEFKRLVYWRGMYVGYLFTFDNLQDKKSYAAAPGIDYDFASEVQKRYLVEKPYKNFDKKTLLDFERGFNLVYQSWQDLIDYVEFFIGINEGESTKWILNAFTDVINGKTSTELMASLLEIFKPTTIDEYREAWFVTFSVVMETGLVGLKGYSREEYLQMEKTLPDMISATDSEKRLKKVTQKTHIYEMSEEIQLQVYHSMHSDFESAVDGMVKLINEHSPNNEELKFVLAYLYDENGYSIEAKKILLEIKLSRNTIDDSVEESIQVANQMIKIQSNLSNSSVEALFTNTNNNVLQFPLSKTNKVEKKERKVGRNEPCPCGSGKKYKNCCGK